MTTVAENIHGLLRSVCGDQVGLALSGHLVERLFKKHLANLKSMNIITTGFIIPERVVPNGSLRTRLTFDESAIAILFDGDQIRISDLEVVLHIDLAGVDSLSETAFKYDQIVATPRIINSAIVLEAADTSGSVISQEPTTVFASRRDATLQSAGITDQAGRDKYSATEQAIVLLATRAIRNAFVKAVSIPDVLSVFSGFEIGAGSELFVRDGYLIVKAIAEPILGKCPTLNAKGETRVVPRKQSNGMMAADVVHTPRVFASALTADEISSRTTAGNSTEMDVYGFFPKRILEVPFRGAVRPAITFEKRGDFAPFYYRISCTATIKEQGFGLSVDAIIPPRLILDVPLSITGQAGAGVEIGCVRYEALGAMWDGEVDPFQLIFEVSIDIQSGTLGLMTKIGDVDAKNFRFRTFPEAQFPISEIVDFILGKAAEIVIEQQADSVLNITRITLADFSVLDNFSGIRKAVSQHGIAGAAGSFLAGVTLEL